MKEGHYSIILDHEQGLVRVTAQGEISKNLGEELITNARKKAADNHFNIFCDVRESTAKVSFSDWFFLPRTLTVYLNHKTRFVRTAILVNKGEQENIYRFFQTVTKNLGLRIRIFNQEDDAIEWLKMAK